MSDLRPCPTEKRLKLWIFPRAEVARCLRPDVVVLGQAFDLIRIEYAIGARIGQFFLNAQIVLSRECAVFDNGRGCLPLENLTTLLLRLSIGHPATGHVTVLRRHDPKHQDIDSPILFAIVTGWQGSCRQPNRQQACSRTG